MIQFQINVPFLLGSSSFVFSLEYSCKLKGLNVYGPENMWIHQKFCPHLKYETLKEIQLWKQTLLREKQILEPNSKWLMN